ncbi:hypothetical protein [Streptomyces sp. NPDC021622]|uniref:hypothetical protein n=1 Tax=Streptomyces sp. NPDC021622 TaxID=3155013 RepID=UPI0033E75B0E
MPDAKHDVAIGSPPTTAPPAPDVRVYFLGAITHSQVAINSGTVTQTMVKEFTETYLGGTAQALSEPEGGSVSSEPDQPQQPTQQPWSAAMDEDVRSISAETFCRRYLPLMLDDLQRRIPELGLSRAAEEALEQTIVDLRGEVACTPVDMKAVAVGMEHIHEALRTAPQNVVVFPDDPRGAPTGEGAL